MVGFHLAISGCDIHVWLTTDRRVRTYWLAILDFQRIKAVMTL